MRMWVWFFKSIWHSKSLPPNSLYNYFSGCECNLDGSVDNVCALEDGKCTCKDNIAGHNCDKSAECWWNFPNPEGIINSSKLKYNM